jgi:hypothetical protein
MALIINYNPTHGQGIPDGQTAYFAQTVYSRSQMPNKRNKKVYSVLVGSKAVVHHLRRMVAEKKIPANHIQFKYRNQRLNLDKKSGTFIVLPTHELYART